MPDNLPNADKIRYIFRLIVTTPRFALIILLQLVSGFFTICGIPMLIPVIESLKTGQIGGEASERFQALAAILETLGMGMTFNSLLVVSGILIVTGQVMVFMSTVVANFAQQDISADYRRRVFSAYSSVDWLWLLSSKSGEMHNAVLREADAAGVAHLNSQRLVIYCIQAMVFLCVALMLSFSATRMAMGVYLGLFVLNSVNSKFVNRLSGRFNEAFKRLANATANLLQNKKFFKASFLFEAFLDKVSGVIDQAVKYKKRIILLEELQLFWNLMITATFLFVLIGFRNSLGLTVSELLLIVVVFMRIGPYVTSLYTAYLALNVQMPIHRSIEQRIHKLEQNAERSGTGAYDPSMPVRLQGVDFAYPDGKKVIQDLSLVLNSGQTTALVGSSGAGKSTILDLLLGMLTPDAGSIWYGDVPHDQLNRHAFRRQVAYVGQETTMIDGTLRENLTIGRPGAGEKIIQDIVEKVQLSDFVERLPEGLETLIGENGIKLSGGQRQRIALGRALIMQPSILILDEATSEMDTETEAAIQEVIRQQESWMTTLIVAHRLSTVRSADTIYVIEKGHVEESGGYEDLMAAKGRFYYLNSLQSNLEGCK